MNTTGPRWNERMRCLRLVVLHVDDAFLKTQGRESGQPIGAASTFTCIHGVELKMSVETIYLCVWLQTYIE